jgi:hypothetical protein
MLRASTELRRNGSTLTLYHDLHPTTSTINMETEFSPQKVNKNLQHYMTYRTRTIYSKSNSPKSLASGAGKVIEPRLTSQVRRTREVVCA